VKVAEGDKNWREIQSRMHKLEEAAAAAQVRGEGSRLKRDTAFCFAFFFLTRRLFL
jgi:hypothetical protein